MKRYHFAEVNSNLKKGNVIYRFKMPFLVTNVTNDCDPYLYYNKHFQAVSLINGLPYGGAITECINSHCDIIGAINGTVKSRYV